MSNKQIEEMGNEIMTVVMRNRNMLGVAETLYNAGYRKQSKGEWIDADPNGHLYRFTCSLCGKTKLGKGTPFCPNCGAKMSYPKEQ